MPGTKMAFVLDGWIDIRMELVAEERKESAQSSE